MGLETFCFAWSRGAVCKPVVDHFYDVSIYDTDTIVSICREIGIDGVVSNASEKTAQVQARVAEQLSLNATPYSVMMTLQNKYKVRQMLDGIEGLEQPQYYLYQGEDKDVYPCVSKPCIGGG